MNTELDCDSIARIQAICADGDADKRGRIAAVLGLEISRCLTAGCGQPPLTGAFCGTCNDRVGHLIESESSPSTQARGPILETPAAPRATPFPDFEVEYRKLARCYTRDGLKGFIAEHFPDLAVLESSPSEVDRG